MKVWHKAITAAAQGKLTTFDALTTITIKKNATTLLGFYVLIVTPKPTSGISGIAALEINSADLGISQQKVIIGQSLVGDGIATNNKELYVMRQFIPWKLKDNSVPIGNAKVTFGIASLVAVTEGFDLAISLVFSDGEPDADFAAELKGQYVSSPIGGDFASSAAGIAAAAETAFTEVISVNANGSELISIMSLLITNAPTADEGSTGYTKLQSSQIEDFDPQEIPFAVGTHGSLGTPVGTPAVAEAKYIPTRFPLPGIAFDINVSQKMAVVLSNAGDGHAAATWR